MSMDKYRTKYCWLTTMAIGAVIWTASDVSAQQPNFIFFVPDQLRAQEVGCYGNPIAQTPNMDSLAAQGIRFECAVPGLPVCTPSRACMLTGRMPFAVRSTSVGYQWMVVNKITMDTKEITIAEQLNALEYTCGHVGSKWHVEDTCGLCCISDRQGFTFFEGLNSYGVYDEPKYCDNAGTLQSKPGRWMPDVTMDSAINFITNNQNNPFYLNIWTSVPHAPRDLHWGQYHPLNYSFDGRMDLWDMFSSVSIPLRPNVPSSLSTEAENQLREYNAMTAGVDQCLGRILNTLDTLGIDDRTIIVISADHGSQLGSHATAFDTPNGWEKNEIYDESICLPLIVYDPRNPGAQVISDPVTMMDFMPTIVELAGGTPNPRVQGRSFAPLVTGSGTYQPRDAVMVQYNTTRFEDVGYGRSRALRTSQWKYGLFEVGSGSGNLQGKALFDLVNDPYELNNLIDNPTYATIRNQLHARLMTEMELLLDPLVVPPKPEIKLNIDSLERSIAKGVNLPNDGFTVTNIYVGDLHYTITDDATWLSTNPDNGTCLPDETDNIIIQYSTLGLDRGDYQATICVEDSNAVNSPKEITVSLNVYIPGDFDEDDDVDLEDFGHFQACLTGPGQPYSSECEDADFNKNRIIDENDFVIFQACLSGPNKSPGC